MLRDGQTVLNGKVHEIRESFGRTKVYLESNLTKEQLLAVAGVEEVLAREDGSYDITIADPAVGKPYLI